MTLTPDDAAAVSPAIAEYRRNMARLAALDRLLAALKAYQADPWSHSWQPVLKALKEIKTLDAKEHHGST